MGGSSRRSGPGKFSKLRREGDGMRDVGGAAIASNVIGDEEDELHVAAAHAVNSARRSDGCDDDDDDDADAAHHEHAPVASPRAAHAVAAPRRATRTCRAACVGLSLIHI